MADRFAELHREAAAWLERARAVGWLGDADLAPFRAVEHAAPADLFAEPSARPLVVAFFGGTGVGKSSLLNRLAGEAVARVGVERPTSHEVTLYLHESIALADLSEAFPVEQVRVAHHHDARQRDVVWIDMPDIDSTVAENRDLALAWLPHIDLLIYVVSPERYRDDAGWRQLQARGHRHGWAFVMNRSDEGDPRQADDFAAELHRAGFAAPLVVRTACVGKSGGPDDRFAELAAAIRATVDAHGVRELERLGQRARLHELRAALAGATARLGDAATWAGLGLLLTEEWGRVRSDVGADLSWPIAEAATRIALRHGAREGGPVRAVGAAIQRLSGRSPVTTREGRVAPAGEVDDGHVAERLWDAAAQARLGRAMDRLEVAARRRGVAVVPLLARLQAVVEQGPATAGTALRTALGRAVARPGTRLQRVARRATKAAMVVLPAAAAARVVYDVVAGYGRGLAGDAPFLGPGFALHATLLVAIAWLAPAILHRLLRPDLRRAVVRGLTAGLESGLDAIEEDLNVAFAQATEERQGLLGAVDDLLTALDCACRPGHTKPPPAVGRLIAETSVEGGG